MYNLNKIAFRLGEELAKEIMNNPRKRLDWDFMEETDDIPGQDVVFLKSFYGSITPEIERAYREGFNKTFIPGKHD